MYEDRPETRERIAGYSNVQPFRVHWVCSKEWKEDRRILAVEASRVQEHYMTCMELRGLADIAKRGQWTVQCLMLGPGIIILTRLRENIQD